MIGDSLIQFGPLDNVYCGRFAWSIADLSAARRAQIHYHADGRLHLPDAAMIYCETCQRFTATDKESLTVQPAQSRAAPLYICRRCGKDCSKTDCLSRWQVKEEERGDGYDSDYRGMGGNGKHID